MSICDDKACPLPMIEGDGFNAAQQIWRLPTSGKAGLAAKTASLYEELG